MNLDYQTLICDGCGKQISLDDPALKEWSKFVLADYCPACRKSDAAESARQMHEKLMRQFKTVKKKNHEPDFS